MQKKFQGLYRKQNKIYVTTSGISNIEKECIRKEFPSNFIIEDVMTTATSYLFVYRCTFTDKYIQALKWRIPIVHIQYLYNVEDSISKFLLLPFEGSNFTTSMISNDMFKNFYVLQGGKYKQDIDYNTDFLVTDSEGDKKEYATKYGIPIIPCTDVFLNNYRLYKRNSDVVILEANDFANLTFYLDKNLPTLLFKTLKRKIIEGNGLRVPVIDKEVDFVITSPILYDSIVEKIDKRDADYFEDRILHYQYIFDCVERKKIIKHEFYTINKVTKKGILKNCVCCIDKSLEASKHAVTNKIIALGGIVKENARSGITHLVIKNKKEYTSNTRKKLPYKVVMTEWIDQCLYNLRFMNEEKYIYRKPVLELQKAKSAPLFVKSRVTYAQEDDKEILFQFTGLSPSLKSRAIEILSKYQIRYIDSDRFEGCTHLIMGLLCTSEKFMCSVAKGNWILIPDFINDFDGSNTFDFSKYEWTVDENTDEKHVKLVKSIKKWRERVISTKNGAFYGWIVKFECEDNKKASLTSLIISGGGQVTESDTYTHIFVSKKYLKDYSSDKCFSYQLSILISFYKQKCYRLNKKYK